MRQALYQAELAYAAGEIPVGAVLVAENKIIAKAHNLTERLTDVTAHAEILAITSAENALGAKYLPQCTLYVTLEPCLMCAGAIFWAQVKTLVFGASDDRRGFLQYQLKIENERTQSPKNQKSEPSSTLLHPKTTIIAGVLEEDCKTLMQSFFQEKREKGY
jgi:tRNA(adenine34) deaminase